MKKFTYWLVETSKLTGEKKFAVGQHGPRMYIQGKEEDVKRIVACFNKEKECMEE